MAEIFVQNALKAVDNTLKVNNGLGVSESDIRTAVDAAIAGVTTSSVFDQQYTLERLGCLQQMSSCCCNYSGSGTNGVSGGSLWGDMTPAPAIGNIYVKLMNQSEMADIGTVIDALESTQLKNNIKQYIELYALSVIDGLTQTLKDFWMANPQSVKVCSSSYNTGVGASCTWIVPTGTSKAKFQVWGAGAGTNPGCCCGGAPFGANGAYSELTINVTPGDSYSVCAGCACSMCCCSNNYPGCACMSGVTGNGICCLKADGGSVFNCCSINCASANISNLNCYKFSNFYCGYCSGACWCSYGEYCQNSCATCGVVPVYPNISSGQGHYCACGTDTATINRAGYCSLHGGGCFDTSHYGYMVRPPILDSDTCTEYTGGCKCATFTSESCAGGALADSWSRHPGMGGAYTHVMGGSNTHKGGKGAGGMVKITWE